VPLGLGWCGAASSACGNRGRWAGDPGFQYSNDSTPGPRGITGGRSRLPQVPQGAECCSGHQGERPGTRGVPGAIWQASTVGDRAGKRRRRCQSKAACIST
jgi:hypothetical protein